jgi:hypothetical protein
MAAASRLYQAVAEGRRVDEVRAAIEACAPPGAVTRSSSSRWVAALNRVERNERNVASRHSYAPKPWHATAAAELLSSGCPFNPENAPYLLPIAASLMQQQEIDLEIFHSGRLLWDWRGHEATVHLALQMQETRFYERRVAEREAEVRRLEAELRALEEEEEEQKKAKEEEEKRRAGQGGSG